MRSIGNFRRFGISEAARTFGVTARAIKFYEERAAIQVPPDRLNHRRYDAEARRRLVWIAQLRSTGLGVPEIAELHELGGAAAGRGRGKHERRRTDLQKQLDVVLAMLRSISTAPGKPVLREAAR